MNALPVPVLVASDTASPWQAVWDPTRESPDAVTAVERLGYPVAYWTPAVGLLGQWRWPDDSVSRATVMPLQLQREPGGALQQSTDGGLTWQLREQSKGSTTEGGGGWGIFAAAAIAAVAIGMFAGTLREPNRR